MEISILRPDDWHVHLRSDDIAKTVVPLHSMFNRMLVMPNVPPITTERECDGYWAHLCNVSTQSEYVMSIMLNEHTILPKSDIDNHTYANCKIYPRGVTTGSEHGVTDIKKLAHQFEAMEERKLILSIHAEDPDTRDIFRREEAYLSKSVDWVVRTFPGLRVVVEHVSSAYGVDFIRAQHNNVAGTITAHHLELTYSDTYGQPHNVCCPCPKSYADLCALKNAIYDSKFFFGSDSAPHLRANKEAMRAANGVFVPGIIALNTLLNVFGRQRAEAEHRPDAWDKKWFEEFTAIRGAKFYKMPVTTETIKLIKKPWTVPQEYGGIVPYKYGQTLDWQINDHL